MCGLGVGEEMFVAVMLPAMFLFPRWICIWMLLVASQGAAAVTSISSIIDCGCKMVFVWERMRVRCDYYLGLKGLISCQGVYFPSTSFSRSLSKVLGNVSRHNSRTGCLSGRVRRPVA